MSSDLNVQMEVFLTYKYFMYKFLFIYKNFSKAESFVKLHKRNWASDFNLGFRNYSKAPRQIFTWNKLHNCWSFTFLS